MNMNLHNTGAAILNKIITRLKRLAAALAAFVFRFEFCHLNSRYRRLSGQQASIESIRRFFRSSSQWTEDRETVFVGFCVVLFDCGLFLYANHYSMTWTGARHLHKATICFPNSNKRKTPTAKFMKLIHQRES